MRNARAEALGRDPALRGAFACATSRALGPVGTCLELSLPLVRPGGRAVLFRGPAQEEVELAAARAVAPLLGGAPPEVVRYALPGGAGRRLLVVEKAGVTPEQYPRRDGVPAKRPLGPKSH